MKALSFGFSSRLAGSGRSDHEMGVIEVNVPAQDAPDLRQDLWIIDEVQEHIVFSDEVWKEEVLVRAEPFIYLSLMNHVHAADQPIDLGLRQSLFDDQVP